MKWYSYYLELTSFLFCIPSAKFISIPLVIPDGLIGVWTLMLPDDRFNRSLLLLYFQFGTFVPLFGSLCSLQVLLLFDLFFGGGFFRSYDIAHGDTGFAVDCHRSPWLDSMAMKITCGKPTKRNCVKAPPSPSLVPSHSGLTSDCRSLCAMMYHPSRKVSSVFLFTCLSKITLTSTWKEVKKIIKEDPRCIKFSSSDRVRKFCLEIYFQFININWVLNQQH